MGRIDDKPTTDSPVDKDACSPLVTNIGIETKGTTSKTGAESDEDYAKKVGHTAYDILLVIYNNFREKHILSIGGVIAVIMYIIALVSGHIRSWEDIKLVFICIICIYGLLIFLCIAQGIYQKIRDLLNKKR